jgi:hypothetical protein
MTESWWSPSTDCTFFICRANRRAGLPTAGAIASLANRARRAALRARCSASFLAWPGAARRERREAAHDF